MIIGKARIAIALISLVLCVAILSGCGISKEDKAALELLKALKDQSAGETFETPEEYLIIIPATCSGELSLLAKELSAKIEEKTKIECNYEYDNVEVGTNKDRVDILLGKTNRRISIQALNKFKNDDYICKLVDGALVIGGVSDAATITAAQRFMNEILANATAYSLMSSTDGFEYYGEYMLGEVLVCGYDVSDYVISYADAEAQCMALSFRDLIAKDSGIYLEVKAGKSSRNEQKEILLDIDEQSAEALAKRVGEDVHLIGKDAYALSVAISSFYNMLLASKTGSSVSVDISDQLMYSYATEKMKVTSTFSDIQFKDSSLPAISALAGSINASGNDIVVLAGIDRDVWTMAKSALSSAYEMLELETSDGVLVPVLYLRGSVRVIENTTVSIDGKQAPKLVLEYGTRADKYTLYCFSHSSLNYATVNQIFKSTDGATMAVIASPYDSNALVVPDDAISVVYNGISSVGMAQYSHVWMVSYPKLLADGQIKTTSDGTEYVSFEVGNRYCYEYRSLMSY